MKKIYILVFILLYSCAKPTVVEVVQTGDELLNCTELKQEIEETNKIKDEAEFSKDSGGNIARAILFWPAWAQSLNNADDAMIAANNRSFHLIKLMRNKNCPGADDLKAKLIDKPIQENISGSSGYFGSYRIFVFDPFTSTTRTNCQFQVTTFDDSVQRQILFSAA